MGIKAVAGILILVVLIVIVASAVVITNEPNGNTLEIKNEFEVGDYYTQDVQYKDQSDTRELKIIDYDDIEDLYTVEDKRIYTEYDPTIDDYVLYSIVVVEDKTAQQLINSIAPSIENMKKNIAKEAEAYGYHIFDFNDSGYENLEVDEFGDMRCHKYEISYGDDLGMKMYYELWFGDGSTLLKQIAGNTRGYMTLTFHDTSMFFPSSEAINPTIYTVKQEFEIDDSYYHNYRFDTDTGWDGFEIFDYGEDGSYIMDSTKAMVRYDPETERYYVEVEEEIKDMTRKEILYDISPSLNDLKDRVHKNAELTKATDVTFKKLDSEFVDGDMFGNVKATKYEGSMYIEYLDATVKYVFWLIDNNILVKESLMFINDETVSLDLTVGYTDMIVPVDEN